MHDNLKYVRLPWYIPGTNPFTHPSCSYYYLLSPNILFLHILFVVHFYSIAHFTFFTYIYALVLCYFYNFYFILLHCPLSGPDLIYISLLIIPCIIYYVTNKETLNLGCTNVGDVTCCGHIPLVFMQWNQHFKKHQKNKINKYILNVF